MSKTFSYTTLNEKAYHQKLDMWFTFILLGVLYASLWQWVVPDSSFLTFLLKASFPLSMAINILWFFGFVLTFCVLAVTKDLAKHNHLISNAASGGSRLVAKVLLDRLFQSTTIENEIVVFDHPVSGVFHTFRDSSLNSGYLTNVVVYEPNSLLAFIFPDR